MIKYIRITLCSASVLFNLSESSIKLLLQLKLFFMKSNLPFISNVKLLLYNFSRASITNIGDNFVLVNRYRKYIYTHFKEGST